jgi:hypothetical protein
MEVTRFLNKKCLRNKNNMFTIFNEIFGYSGLGEFQKTMDKIRPYRL